MVGLSVMQFWAEEEGRGSIWLRLVEGGGIRVLVGNKGISSKAEEIPGIRVYGGGAVACKGVVDHYAV